MTKMFRRLLALLLVVCLVFSLALLTGCGKDEDEKEDGKTTIDANKGRGEFIDSIGGVSETYTGAVSEESFETKEEAVEAFVNEQIVGTSQAAVIESTVSKGELSDTEIAALNLPADIAGDVDSVEELEVTYTETSYYSAIADSTTGSKKITVYIVKCGPDFKYFTPCPVDGETITKSYYESVFDNEKYANCTYVNSSYLKLEAQGQTMEMTLTQTIKRDGNKIYIKQIVEGDPTLVAQALPFGTDEYMEVYIEKSESGSTTTKVKMSADGSWQDSNLVFTVDPFAGQDRLDYSYFSKANFGFALKGENAIKFYRSYANGYIPDDAKLDLYAEYYVKEGVLSGMRMEYSADITQEAYGVTVRSITTGLNKMSCTEYGTTVVEDPTK